MVVCGVVLVVCLCVTGFLIDFGAPLSLPPGGGGAGGARSEGTVAAAVLRRWGGAKPVRNANRRVSA